MVNLNSEGVALTEREQEMAIISSAQEIACLMVQKQTAKTRQAIAQLKLAMTELGVSADDQDCIISYWLKEPTSKLDREAPKKIRLQNIIEGQMEVFPGIS